MAKYDNRHKISRDHQIEAGKEISVSVNPCCFNLAECEEKESSFEITNKNSYPLYFKLLTTNAFAMCFQPQKGRVEPHSKVVVTGRHVQSTRPIGLQQKVAIMTSRLPLDQWPEEEYYKPISHDDIQDSYSKSKYLNGYNTTLQSPDFRHHQSSKAKTTPCCNENHNECFSDPRCNRKYEETLHKKKQNDICPVCNRDFYEDKFKSRHTNRYSSEETEPKYVIRNKRDRKHDYNTEDKLNVSIICHCEHCSESKRKFLPSFDRKLKDKEKRHKSSKRTPKHHKKSLKYKKRLVEKVSSEYSSSNEFESSKEQQEDSFKTDTSEESQWISDRNQQGLLKGKRNRAKKKEREVHDVSK
ncbi:MSP domain-containing protein [Nephila pilipes]|uniref:MSP domain-containing protein n=1 Tax=Nephila pilipes TaxID=299642 RepID=A0A8X6PRH0_NEPPI|nr:MSP domain-containing protein [Nephila pilipes]